VSLHTALETVTSINGGLVNVYLERAITAMRAYYPEPLRLEDLAREATMSKFHFLRTFRDATGMTPVSYLSAVRIQEAKKLLARTTMNVADISVAVGYCSVGTFTRRFTGCVGLSPTTYRRAAHGEPVDLTPAPHPKVTSTGTVCGTVSTGANTASQVLIGMFDSPLVQGKPVSCRMVDADGPWQVADAPAGTWHLLAVAVAQAENDAAAGAHRHSLLIGSSGSVRVTPGRQVRIDLRLRPVTWDDPPLLTVLPGIEANVH